MELDSGFAYRVKRAVNMKEVSYSAVGRHLGVSPQAIQQWASGQTKSPLREHVEKAAAFLRVRFEWLAYGRGPAVAPDPDKEPQTRFGDDGGVLVLSHDWEESLRAALPERMHSNLHPKVPHPSGMTQVTTGWVSDTFLADFGLYKGQALNLVQFARQKLWMLAVLRSALPPVRERRTVLILSPLEEWRGSPEKQIEALRAEAGVLGIEVIHSVTPEHVAALLAGQTDEFGVLDFDELGLEISPVLQ